MAKRFKGDIIIWTVILILCVYSSMSVYSGIAKDALTKPSNTEALFSNELLMWGKHFFLIITGLIIMWVIHLIKWHNALQKSGTILLIISCILLILTILFGNRNVGEAARWLNLGFISFQTSDIAKLTLVIYLASVFSHIHKYEKDFKQMVLRVYLPIFIICGLIAKEGNSTAAILFTTAIVMMFVARLPFKHIFSTLGICAVGVAFMLLISGPKEFNKTNTANITNRTETAKSRFETYFSDNIDPHSQEFKSINAIINGGLTGKMPGKSIQRYSLAKIESDFIFAIIVEEYGLLFGAIPIIALFMILMFRGVKISLRSNRAFSSYLVIGITFMYVLQAFINILVCVGMIPVTGQPMPFVSKGGTMFIVCCAAFGLVLSESRINDEERMQSELQIAENETEDKKVKIKNFKPQIV